MDHLNMHTPNLATENFKKLAALFPNAVTETIDEATGEVVRAIDKDVLMQEISARVVEGREERYQFTWPDKKKAVLAANAPIAATLRPVRADSVGKDGTPGGWDSENLYIEGDNLDVLKLLQETYLGKVKMIYIDPPYNTGNDFVYEDDFAEDAEEYLARSGQFDEQGNRLEQNTESNGRFHTDWLNMIYPRLKLAKNLLSEDGAIFVSIDSHEQPRLRMIMDEVFGIDHFISEIACVNKPSGRSDDKYIATAHESILVYCKSFSFSMGGFAPEEHITKRYNKRDQDGRLYREEDLRKRGTHDERYDRPNLFYPFFYCESTDDLIVGHNEDNTPNGYIRIEPIKSAGVDGTWRWGRETALEQKKYIHPRYMPNKGQWSLFEWEYLDERGYVKPTSVWSFKDVNSERGTEVFIKNLGFNKTIFPNPKPVGTIERIIRIAARKDDIILDFFSGSATTAHAVMQLNAEDGGHRRFIMVQIPEKTDESSEAYKAGYKNICEIGKERIRRAGQKIIEEKAHLLNAARSGKLQRGEVYAEFTNSEHAKETQAEIRKNLDIGFRVFRLDSTNMQDVYYTPSQLKVEQLDALTDNIKPDRTPEDLLFQVMLDLGVELSSTITETEIDGKHVFDVADGFLLACFDAGVTTETVTAIAKKRPYYAVFRDSSMADDSVATNFDQIFETYSPQTVRRVL